MKSLGEICEKTKSGGTPKSTIKEYYEGNIPFLSISDMTIQGKYLFSTERNISELGLKSSASWIVPINSIIYSMYASVGFVSINKIELATSQAVLNLIPKNEINREYLYYYLVYFQKYVDKYITTGTQGNLNAETVKSFEIYLPTSKEQNTIVQFLSSIDTKIETEKNILDKYHSQKQYLLQNLFI
ncbi:restriction endonuclease subunit S [Sphingobacterium multivorum]|uniref:restriction endonuclease subunit S n=1 Tax=Sphingobacterium multivorum TaxID=28454 RepID=UPI001558A1CA|nr:restriction endonuclease subunit S [Sphingobacterium multivorum]QRQ59985.1 restriction endonuclease subunit S [Sphingobacterium multivorum]